MSWWSRSISNSLKLDEDDGNNVSSANPESKQDDRNHSAESPTSPPRGVKDDLSDLTKSLTRQFWGVASFLAPPPQHETRTDGATDDSDPDLLSGIRNDFAEIGGKFRSGISRLSSNINVSEFTKIASDFLQLESDDEEGKREGFDLGDKGAVGVTEEVVAFARDVSMHPETWLDFPRSENVDDDAGFDMSDAQQEHALAIERLVPRLAALRIELCPGYMSESHFWKIYFVLLHTRLNDHDAEWLSTPEILKTRDLLAQELKNRSSTKLEDVYEEKPTVPEIRIRSQVEEPVSVPSPVPSGYLANKASSSLAYSETFEHQTDSSKTEVDEMPVAREKDIVKAKDQIMKSVSSSFLHENDEEDADEWLKEENSEIFSSSGVTVPIENEEGVSFSDLEDDDDDGDVPTRSKNSTNSFKKSSPEWVQLRESSSDSSKDIDVKNSDNESVNAHDTKESNDWLDVDDIDVA